MKLFSLNDHLGYVIKKFERKYRKHYSYFFFLESLFLTTNILTPIFIKKTIDSAFYKSSMREIAIFSSLYLITLLFQTFIMYKLNYLASKNLLNNSRVKESKSVYAKIISLPLSMLNPQNTGEYFSIFVRDIPKATSEIYAGRLQFYFNIVFFFVVLLLLLILNVKLTIIVFISVLLFYLSTSTLKKFVIKTSKNDRESYNVFLKRYKEIVEGISILKQYPNSKLIENYLDTSAKKWSKDNIKFRTVTELSNQNIEINKWFGSTFVLGFGVYLLWKGKISVGTLVAFEAYMNWIYDIVRMGLTGLNMFFSSIPNWENFTKVFSYPFEQSSGIKLKNFKKLEARHVGFEYDKTVVLTNVNIEINSGEKVAIVGGLGVRKSTLVYLFNNFLSPTSGKILINDIPIEQFLLPSLRKNIILVKSNDILFDTSIKNNVTLFEDFPEEEVKRILKMCECDFVEKMEGGIDSVVGERGAKLSDGQRQRIILAMALIRKPKY